MSYGWGMSEANFLESDGFQLDELILQSQALKDDAANKKSDDDSGLSSGISSDAGASSPESFHGSSSHHEVSSPVINIKQETQESLHMGMTNLPSPDTHSGQLSDSYYSNHSNSSPEPERTGSKKTAYNEKWGVKVLKGKLRFTLITLRSGNMPRGQICKRPNFITSTHFLRKP